MRKKTVYLTQDHISLIRFLKFNQIDGEHYGVDSFSPWGGTYPLEDMAYILGYANRVIRDSQNSYIGPRYEEEVQNYLMDLSDDFVLHLTDYEEILHQFSDRGGLKVGKYLLKSGSIIWEYLGEGEEEQSEDKKPPVVEKDWDMLSDMG